MLQLQETLSLATLEENMVFIEGGVFEMGSEEYDNEKPIHQVRISDFELCRYPVTVQLWREVMGKDPEVLRFDSPEFPVTQVSWDDITQEFLPTLRKKTNCEAYCLPSEAQWEYAARGGRYSEGYRYAGSDKLEEVGWVDNNSGASPREVGLLLPNELGLYDLSGNVREWCQDNYGSNYYQSLKDQYGAQPAPDPKGPKNGRTKVVRGGSWINDDLGARVALRFNSVPYFRSHDVGFRLCRYPGG